MSVHKWLCSLSLGLLGISVVMADVGDIHYTQASRINLRAEPNLRARVLKQLQPDRRVVEFSRRGDWIEVGVYGSGGLIGWVHNSLLGDRRTEVAD